MARVPGDYICPLTGLRLPILPGRDPDAMERILDLRGTLAGKKVLLVGAGKSGEAWADHCDDETVVVACNSTIKQLADRAQMFLCTEGNGYEMAWYHTETNALRVVSYCNLKRPHIPRCLDAIRQQNVVPIERSWHLAGFNPLEYFNPEPLPHQIQGDPHRNWYARYRTYIGYDRYNNREWGLLKGPVCYTGTPSPMCVGTVYVNGLHLLSFMGARRIDSIGFDFCQKEATDHWTEPTFKYVPTRWASPDCFVKINGLPTMWHFALSAAWAMKLRPKFAAAGVEIVDHSQGLMDLPGIENLMQHIGDKPRDFEFGLPAVAPKAKAVRKRAPAKKKEPVVVAAEPVKKRRSRKKPE